MPRLLLVIDEFAMLAKDYPDVLSRWSASPRSGAPWAST